MLSSRDSRKMLARAAATAVAITLAVLHVERAEAAPAASGVHKPRPLMAGTTSRASSSSVHQTKRNSRNYRRQKERAASRNRAKIRRATRGRRHGNDHQPGGYCMYDTRGNVILKPNGVECNEQKGDYMAAEGSGAAAGPAARSSGAALGCISGSCTDGVGVYVWSNGTSYSGGFKGNRQHGQGTLTMPDGTRYEGGWRSGKKHGKGVAIYSDGRVQKGHWKDNKYAGKSLGPSWNIRWPDLAIAPPKTAGGGKNDAAVVVGITRYAHVSEIEGANTNASDWYQYLVKSRGVPFERTTMLLDEDATVEEMRLAIEEASRNVRKGGTLWFVFVGHGAPAKDGKDGLLIGFDAQQKARSIEARSLRRSELLATLQESRAKNIQVMLDACFSGKSASGEQLVAGLQPLVITSLDGDEDPRTTLMTAAGGDEYAGPLPGASRPAFSYLALGGLRGWADSDRNGKITSGELHSYVSKTMQALVRDRRQRPTLTGDNNRRLVKSGREKGPDIAKIIMSAAARR